MRWSVVVWELMNGSGELLSSVSADWSKMLMVREDNERAGGVS